MHNKYEEIGNYDYQMIEAYIDKPDVTQWYVNAFNRFNINGVDRVAWNWSWWAFIGSVFFLLHRKAYGAAGVLSLLLCVGWFIPFGWLLLWILSGGYSSYFIYKTYKDKRLRVEAEVLDEDKRFETMRILGGSNEWAIVVGVIAQFFIWSTGIFMIGFILAFLSLIGVALGNAA
ncbi:MAG: hypothetical protein COA44_10535 [Arcobacter sp.]|nr:MAG: hypothetical protein COA44_10535 [Arcobacter sp.]